MKDFPYAQKISIFEAGSLIGEDDLFKGGNHSTTLTCNSKKGTLYHMRKDQFYKLRKNDNSWKEVLSHVAYR